MKVIKRVHAMWKEIENVVKTSRDLKEKRYFKKMFNNIGKYQYIFESEKGTISLITLPNYFFDNRKIFEIYCLKGNLFEDIERFYSRKKAVKRIEELLK